MIYLGEIIHYGKSGKWYAYKNYDLLLLDNGGLIVKRTEGYPYKYQKIFEI